MKNLALLISILGIFILLILINIQEPKLSSIYSIKNKDVNEKVKIQGKIIDLKSFGNSFTIAKIKDNSGYIEIISNYPKIKQYKNSTFEIIGRLTEYKGNLQIQADKIKLIK